MTQQRKFIPALLRFFFIRPVSYVLSLVANFFRAVVSILRGDFKLGAMKFAKALPLASNFIESPRYSDEILIRLRQKLDMVQRTKNMVTTAQRDMSVTLLFLHRLLIKAIRKEKKTDRCACFFYGDETDKKILYKAADECLIRGNITVAGTEVTSLFSLREGIRNAPILGYKTRLFNYSPAEKIKKNPTINKTFTLVENGDTYSFTYDPNKDFLVVSGTLRAAPKPTREQEFNLKTELLGDGFNIFRC